MDSKQRVQSEKEQQKKKRGNRRKTMPQMRWTQGPVEKKYLSVWLSLSSRFVYSLSIKSVDNFPILYFF